MEKKNKIYILLTAVILIVSIGVVTVGVRSLLRNRAMDAELSLVHTETVPEPTEIIREVEVVKVVEKEKVITGEMLQEGLNKMGFLITQEYYLTEVLHYSDVRCVPVFQWKIPLGESSSVFSYDCQVDAGIDFEKIRVDKDEEQKVITVSVPTAELRPPLVVHDSFQLYSEKNNVFIPVSMEDYNDAIVELEHNAAERAKEKNILEKANEQAQAVIANFIRSLVNVSEYTLKMEPLEAGGI